MKAGYYRPMFHHQLEATLAPDGGISAWRHRLVGQSIIAGSPFECIASTPTPHPPNCVVKGNALYRAVARQQQ